MTEHAGQDQRYGGQSVNEAVAHVSRGSRRVQGPVRSERSVAAAFVGGRPAQKILGSGRGGLTVGISLSQGLLPSCGSQGSPRL
jgi:hypothetical protein